MSTTSVTSLLAHNLRAVLDRDILRHGAHLSAKRWSEMHHIDPKVVTRALAGQHAATLDTLQRLSEAASLEPWQLLYPALDPSNPPAMALSDRERELYTRLADAARALPGLGEKP